MYDTDQYKAVTLKLYQEVEGLDEFQERATISIDSTLVDLGKVSYVTRGSPTASDMGADRFVAINTVRGER